MQQTLRTTALPNPAQALSNPDREANAIARSATATRPGSGWRVAQVWREGWDAFVACAAPILGLAVVGWAGPTIAFLSLATWLGVSDYAQVSGPLVTYQSLALLHTDAHVAFGLLLAQAVLAMLAAVSAQAGVTALLLRSSATIHLRHVLRAWPALLLNALLRGALLAVPAIAINLPLRGTAYDLGNLGQKAYTFGGMAQVVVLRTFNEFISVPNTPFTEFVPLWRQTLGRWPKSGDDYTQRIASEYNLPDLTHAATSEAHWMNAPAVRVGFVIACSMALMLMDVLMRLQPMAIVHAAAMGRTPLAGFLRGMQLSLRYFGRVAAHSWGLRVGMAALGLGCITLPQVIYESLIVADAIKRMLAGVSLAPAGASTFLLAWAVWGCVSAAFCSACDVRLYTNLYCGLTSEADSLFSARSSN